MRKHAILRPGQVLEGWTYQVRYERGYYKVFMTNGEEEYSQWMDDITDKSMIAAVDAVNEKRLDTIRANEIIRHGLELVEENHEQSFDIE